MSTILHRTGIGRESYQPKTLHVVSGRWRDRSNIVETRVPLSARYKSVCLERLEDFPAPLSVHRVACDAVHHEETLNGLRPLKVVCIQRLDGVVLFPFRKGCDYNQLTKKNLCEANRELRTATFPT